MKKILLITIACMLTYSCVTTPKSMTPEDREIIDPVQEKYMTCLGEKTAVFIDGSDDVNFLVEHILSQCEPLLSDLDSELQKLGFSIPYREGFIRATRNNGREVTTSFILQEKAKNKTKNQ